MTYSEKLRDPRWQRKRLEILQKYNFKCEACWSGEDTLHVHHTYYVKGREPWEYPDSSLEVLCENCHRVAAEIQEGEICGWEHMMDMISGGSGRGRSLLYFAVDNFRCNNELSYRQVHERLMAFLAQ